MRRACGLLAVLAVLAAIGGVLSGAPSATAATRPTVAVVTDSYGAGWTGTTRSQADAWWQYTARDLGWTPINIVANPGAGFVKPGDYGTLAQALAAHLIPSWTDYVLIQGGLNDSDQDPAAIPAGVARVIALVR